MVPPVGQDADHAQHGDADHLPPTAHAQDKAIEVDAARSSSGRPPRSRPDVLVDQLAQRDRLKLILLRPTS